MAKNHKQQRFVEEYLVDLNATQAAIRAGYSVQTADKIGSKLVGKSRVQTALTVAMQRRSHRTEITQDAVLKGFANIAFGDVRLADKLRALEALAKHLGMFIERHEVTRKDEMPMEYAALMSLLLRLLAPFPEARVALSDGLIEAEAEIAHPN